MLILAQPALLEAEWRQWMRRSSLTPDGLPRLPKIAVPVRAFVSLALAHHRGHPKRTGDFETLPYPVSFSWASKRDPRGFERRDRARGDLGDHTEDFRSQPYRAVSEDDDAEDARELRLLRQCFDDRPLLPEGA